MSVKKGRLLDAEKCNISERVSPFFDMLAEGFLP